MTYRQRAGGAGGERCNVVVGDLLWPLRRALSRATGLFGQNAVFAVLLRAPVGASRTTSWSGVVIAFE